ncbi:DUF859 domain-containing protein [Streptococcus suis]|uniref:DUF859 family phage minor structural protein n=1 Tax=Streptococcus suis TaxID=1307 RepID=UPI003704AB06|nr:DUF859 domain-containing protein [Streptococcus suis]
MALETRGIKQIYRNSKTGQESTGDAGHRFYIYDNVKKEYIAEIGSYIKAMGLKVVDNKPKSTGYGIFFYVRMLKAVDLRSGGEAFFEISLGSKGVKKKIPLTKKLYPVSRDTNTYYDGISSDEYNRQVEGSAYNPSYEELGFVYIEEPNVYAYTYPATMYFNIATNFFDRSQQAIAIPFRVPSFAHDYDTYNANVYVQSFTSPIGSSNTLNLVKPSQNYSEDKYSLSYYWYGKRGILATKSTATSFKFTLPNHFWDDIPESFDGTGYIILDRWTVVGGRDSLFSTLFIPFRGEVPAHVKPSIQSITLTDTNTKVSALLGNQAFAQILSNISINVSANGIYGSTIKSIRSEIVGKNQIVTSTGGSFGVMNYHGQITIRTTVTDSRDRVSDSVDRVVTVLPYHPPALSFTVSRGGSLRNQLIVLRSVKIAPLTWNGRQNNRLKLNFSTAALGGSFTPNNGSANIDATTIAELINSQATLAGTYSSLSSFEVLGVLSDSFVNDVTFKVSVPTESVVVSYDKHGVGINKVRERGAVDVKGDIYANDKPIQQHKLTENNGVAIIATGDWNNYKETGLYHGNNLANQPPNVSGANVWKYVRVTKHGAGWSLQEAIDFNGVMSCFRVWANNAWKPWQRVALVQPSTWISTGVDGVHYKQEGAVVALRIKVSSTSFVSNYSLGTIPTSLLPVAGTDAMFRVVTNNGTDRIVRIKSTGICQIESYLLNESLTTTITWLI